MPTESDVSTKAAFKVHILPHKGVNYDQQRPRILILGESIYEWASGCLHPNILTDLTRSDSFREYHHRVFARTFQLLTGKRKTEVSKDECWQFWQSVVFCDYVSTPVGNGPRQPPSEEQWKLAKEEFPELLTRFRPDLVVALGVRLWCRLQSSGVIVEKSGLDRAKLRIPGYECHVFAVYHPSSGRFKPTRDHANYITVLEDVKRLL